MNEEEFLKFLEILAEAKKFDFDEVKSKLISAGLPLSTQEEEIPVPFENLDEEVPESVNS